MKAITTFIRKWSDLLVMLPASVLLFIFGEAFIHFLDPTAAVVSVEVLSILSFNVLTLFVIFTAAYFIWNLYFHDLFVKGWQEKVPPLAALIVNAVLWLSTLAVTLFVILRNL